MKAPNPKEAPRFKFQNSQVDWVRVSQSAVAASLPAQSKILWEISASRVCNFLQCFAAIPFYRGRHRWLKGLEFFGGAPANIVMFLSG